MIEWPKDYYGLRRRIDAAVAAHIEQVKLQDIRDKEQILADFRSFAIGLSLESGAPLKMIHGFFRLRGADISEKSLKVSA